MLAKMKCENWANYECAKTRLYPVNFHFSIVIGYDIDCTLCYGLEAASKISRVLIDLLQLMNFPKNFRMLLTLIGANNGGARSN